MTDFDSPAFLAARLDEQVDYIGVQRITDRIDQPLGDFLLADIAAKRAILDERNLRFHEAVEGTSGEGEGQAQGIWWGLNMAVELLCRPFADHDDWPGDQDE